MNAYICEPFIFQLIVNAMPLVFGSQYLVSKLGLLVFIGQLDHMVLLLLPDWQCVSTLGVNAHVLQCRNSMVARA